MLVKIFSAVLGAKNFDFKIKYLKFLDFSRLTIFIFIFSQLNNFLIIFYCEIEFITFSYYSKNISWRVRVC
jgi:hypothetical protein